MNNTLLTINPKNQDPGHENANQPMQAITRGSLTHLHDYKYAHQYQY